MKPLDRYGPALVEYEGAADFTFSQESGSVLKGYFQAKQLTAGGLAIGFLPIARDSGSATTPAERINSEPSFHGRDLEGWDITICGQTWELPFLIQLDTLNSATHSGHVFSPPCIKAKSKWASESGYDQARFRVSNLLWHYLNRTPESISLRIGVLAVTISPSDDYLEAAGSIKAVRGIAPTAEVLIKTLDSSKQSLESYGEFMNDLVCVFRLATGNKVDWYYGEALETNTGRCVERFHKDAITGPFSKTIRFRRLPSGWTSAVPKLNFEALAESFLDGDKQLLDRSILKELVNYFINACDETSYLEARGLLASTLSDLIVVTYLEKKKTHNFMGEKEFNKQMLPAFKEAINSMVLPELSNELRTRAKEQLQGAYRRSFKNRLKLLTEGLELPLDDTNLSKAVHIRNELVHEGTYPSKNRDEWYNQYSFMIWMDLVALCRLTGYEGDLPLFDERRGLEV